MAALGSYLQARSQNGEWLVRVEDLDPPREVPGAANAILRSLQRLGLDWDGPVLYQSTRLDRYGAALDRLRTLGKLYPCSCSRREIAAGGRAGAEGWIYPGTCRTAPDPQPDPQRRRVAWRVHTHDQPIGFQDTVQGARSQRLAQQIGDFVVKRADGLIAYQLAVVVDDAEQGITEVVRGSDLLDSTARQIHLQQLLGLSTPAYLHLPVATDPRGDKLSKQTGAPAITGHEGARLLVEALRFLGQPVEPALERADRAAVLRWAVEHWDPSRIPRVLGQVWWPTPVGRR